MSRVNLSDEIMMAEVNVLYHAYIFFLIALSE